MDYGERQYFRGSTSRGGAVRNNKELSKVGVRVKLKGWIELFSLETNASSIASWGRGGLNDVGLSLG